MYFKKPSAPRLSSPGFNFNITIMGLLYVIVINIMDNHVDVIKLFYLILYYVITLIILIIFVYKTITVRRFLFLFYILNIKILQYKNKIKKNFFLFL